MSRMGLDYFNETSLTSTIVLPTVHSGVWSGLHLGLDTLNLK